tara:strand:+ start:89 stop:649 length:561 start_codon:yes stop_codon:yes gene_type:complete
MSINSKEEIQKRAVEMYEADWKTAAIAKELGVHAGTVRRWFKKRGIPARKNGGIESKIDTTEKHVEEVDESKLTKEAAILAKHDARMKEEEEILQIAESQASPADKYQNYIAMAAIRLARDNMKNISGPRNIKELSELDQLIRRNLGLNSKSSGGDANKMQIDISILNNKRADTGNGTVIDIQSDD